MHRVHAQQHELNEGWKCIKASEITIKGEEISNTDTPLSGWLPAIVPGTVLTSQLFNKLIPDPFYGMNNERIPDIYRTGRDYYTYWFVKDFKEEYPEKGGQVYLYFRGVNYTFNVFLNGHKLNDAPDSGMFCSSSYNITRYLTPGGNNRLAVIVFPPEPVGNPNGGQGGDGMIAHNVTNQYVAGWDWIQPIRDRNTGIWDKVFIKRTKQVHVEHTHVVTIVPGKRIPTGKQQPATIRVTTEVEYPADSNGVDTEMIPGIVQFEIAGKKANVPLKLLPHTLEEVEFPDLLLDDPKLWWPNGYGEQNLYPLTVRFLINGKIVSDEEVVTVGIRQIKTQWNTKTNSREIRVNGQRIFIKGGNWILTDALLRFSKERYDDEVRFHRDMNLNLIRVWGGGITERPEFYDACDKYGLLVMQDFWASGDCNGRWYDTFKKEDTNARRRYPDNHHLFIESLDDQIKLLRNHPSLALWCGGNEIRPPQDILTVLRDSLLPSLDGTRFFFEFSNDDSMSLHGGDGPYTIQPDNYFWDHHSFPFNSEIGSVGVGDYESLQRFLPPQNMVAPYYSASLKNWVTDSVWQYHRYTGYDSVIEAYGHPATVEDFTRKAQLVNYNQYRALMEGATSHIWDWYTGIIIWKTQNPWTAMKGQMYDCFLDPNACLYGTRTGSKPLHVLYEPVNKTIMVANNLFKPTPKLELVAKVFIPQGDEIPIVSKYVQVPPGRCNTVHQFSHITGSLAKKSGMFLYLSITDSSTNELVDENLYWLPDSAGNYTGLEQMPRTSASISAKYKDAGHLEITMSNPAFSPLAFFNRVSIVDSITKKRILSVFYSDNYFSVLPGQERTIQLAFSSVQGIPLLVCIEGWNLPKQFVEIKN